MREQDPAGEHASPEREVRGGPVSSALRARRSRAAAIVHAARWIDRTFRGPTSLSLVLVAVAVTVAALGGWMEEGEAEAESSALPEELEVTPEDLVGAELPMEYNERVGHWIERYLTDKRGSFERYLARENLYGPMIRESLRDRDMPEALIYLAMIESGFSPWATSRVAASGVWQFMSPTARAFGLRISPYVDERRDPIRATEAALDYLEELYDQFGSWYLAAAAYNAGPARVNRSLDIVDQDAVDDDAELYWEIIPYLPRETQQYVPRILAAAILGEQAQHFGFDVEAEAPYLFDRVLVPGGVPLARVAEAAGVAPSLVWDMNPHLIQGMTPPGEPTLVRVPQGVAGDVVADLGRTLD